MPFKQKKSICSSARTTKMRFLSSVNHDIIEMLFSRKSISMVLIKVRRTKAKYHKEATFLSSFLLTWSKYTGPKWPWSNQHAGFMSQMHGTSLPSTPWPFWTCIFTSGKGAFTNYVYKICPFLTTYPLRLLFLWYKSLQKVDSFDHLPSFSCKGSLWTAPKEDV